MQKQNSWFFWGVSNFQTALGVQSHDAEIGMDVGKWRKMNEYGGGLWMGASTSS